VNLQQDTEFQCHGRSCIPNGHGFPAAGEQGDVGEQLLHQVTVSGPIELLFDLEEATKQHLELKRRLVYVGISRAAKELHGVADGRGGGGPVEGQPMPFLVPIREKVPPTAAAHSLALDFLASRQGPR
jgi:superfamily I DNA/RNA helicase